MRFEAIRIVYPQVTNLEGDLVAKDASGNQVVLDETLIQVEYDKLVLAKGIKQKIKYINSECTKQITSGFTSLALDGTTTYYYQSEEIDQLNLIGLVVSGVDDAIKCSTDGITYSYVLHTSAQIKQVLDDGKAYKIAQLTKANDLKVLANAATTQADLDVIVW